MSEITQPPPDVQTQDTNSRVNRLNAASDQNTSNKQSSEQQSGKQTAEVEPEKQISQHDPAVTLASTLSKLDTGSYFQATVTGKDGDGRTIINSELGTYLVEVGYENLEEFQKIQKSDLLEIRVLTIDKAIAAEIINYSKPASPVQQPTTIPVSLTLTELSHHKQITPPNTTTQQNLQMPVEDIRSQYQATTLYKAERMAREIGEKLDNLPLPTNAPNYTVYGSQASTDAKVVADSPRQVSSNVFIQEVRSETSTAASAQKDSVQQTTRNQLLGKDINVQVIKTVPQTPAPLPAGLPASVVAEISAPTPIDNVTTGQSLNINIAAIAIPDAGGQQTQLINKEAISTDRTATPATEPRPEAPRNEAINSPSQAATVSTADKTGLGGTANAVISGIIIDPSRADAGKATQNEPSAATAASSTAYNPKNNPPLYSATRKSSETADKTYYLATPNTILKFQSFTPLIPGTIVSFTVEADKATAAPKPTSVKEAPSSQTIQSNQPSASNSTPGISLENTIPPPIADKIDQFFPQELGQLPEDWGSISLALSALNAAQSAAIATMMMGRIPNLQNPEQITSTIFFFLSALKSSTPARTWLGPDVAAKLKQIGAGRIIDRIDHDLIRIARLGGETTAGEWRPFLIPFQSSGEAQAVPMLTKQVIDEDQKRKNSENGEEATVNATRFILELNFSQFGKVFIDGLLKENRLDIILKSAEIIPLAIKSKISREFNQSLKQSDFDGELVIIDNAPSTISVRKMIETMSQKSRLEKNI